MKNKIMQTSQIDHKLDEQSTIDAFSRFVWLIFRSNMRHLQTLVLNLGTPLAIASMFLITGQQISPIIVPLLFLVSIVFAGSTLGTRLIMWREQKIFRRLAVCTTPIDFVIFGLYISQLAVSITQSLILLLIIVILGVDFTTVQLITTVWTILIACVCFTAFGPVLSTFIQRADMMSYAYLFVAMPTSLLSGMIGVDTFNGLLAIVVQLLPTTMMAELLRLDGPLSMSTILLNSMGLVAYSLIFLSIVRMRSWIFTN